MELVYIVIFHHKSILHQIIWYLAVAAFLNRGYSLEIQEACNKS